MPSLLIRPLQRDDFSRWEILYRGYAAFYQVNQSEQMRRQVWQWIMDPAHEVNGLAGVDGAGELVGITHFRPFARPLSATTGGFLDDLYVDPSARGTGAAQALIDGVRAEGIKRGWSVIRWITAEDNLRARRVYDAMASQTKWVTYDIKL